MASRIKLSSVLIVLFLVIVAVFFFLPFLWLILAAFDPNAGIEFRVPKHPTLRWFAEMNKPVGRPGGVVGKWIKTIIPIRWIINSLIISVPTATLVVLLGVLAGYCLTRFRFRGQRGFITFTMIIRLMPEIVIALPIVVMFVKAHLVNTYLGCILAISALLMPFVLMLAEGYFRTIPIVFEESAMVDGLSRFQAFMKVTLPLAWPGIAVMWIWSFVSAWSEFLLPLVILGDPSLYPASVGIYYWFGMYGRIEYGRICAFSILFSLPVVISFLLLRKYFQRGIAGLVTRA